MINPVYAHHTPEQRIAWHIRKIEEAKARIEYHEKELRRINTCQK